jgi:hypothetical protein
MKRKSNFIDFLRTATEIPWPITSYPKCVLEILNLQKVARRSRQIAVDVQQSFHYFLTPWSRTLLEKLTGFQLVKKFSAFYGTRRFITAFTSARHLPYPEQQSFHTHNN